MARLSYLILKVAPWFLLIGVVLGVMVLLAGFSLADQLDADEAIELVLDVVYDLAATLLAISAIFWFRRIVEKMFPEVLE